MLSEVCWFEEHVRIGAAAQIERDSTGDDEPIDPRPFLSGVVAFASGDISIGLVRGSVYYVRARLLQSQPTVAAGVQAVVVEDLLDRSCRPSKAIMASNRL